LQTTAALGANCKPRSRKGWSAKQRRCCVPILSVYRPTAHPYFSFPSSPPAAAAARRRLSPATATSLSRPRAPGREICPPTSRPSHPRVAAIILATQLPTLNFLLPPPDPTNAGLPTVKDPSPLFRRWQEASVRGAVSSSLGSRRSLPSKVSTSRWTRRRRPSLYFSSLRAVLDLCLSWHFHGGNRRFVSGFDRMSCG
jgi:hypothetical protein